MAPETPIHPDDLDEIASILARGYLRYRESRRRQLADSLASAADTSPHVHAVNRAENGEQGPTNQGDAE